MEYVLRDDLVVEFLQRMENSSSEGKKNLIREIATIGFNDGISVSNKIRAGDFDGLSYSREDKEQILNED